MVIYKYGLCYDDVPGWDNHRLENLYDSATLKFLNYVEKRADKLRQDGFKFEYQLKS